jgi:hypothetical protein
VLDASPPVSAEVEAGGHVEFSSYRAVFVVRPSCRFTLPAFTICNM